MLSSYPSNLKSQGQKCKENVICPPDFLRFCFLESIFSQENGSSPLAEKGRVFRKRRYYSLRRASMGFRRAAWTAGTAPKKRPTMKEKMTVAATMYQLMKMGTPETRDTM